MNASKKYIWKWITYFTYIQLDMYFSSGNLLQLLIIEIKIYVEFYRSNRWAKRFSRLFVNWSNERHFPIIHSNEIIPTIAFHFKREEKCTTITILTESLIIVRVWFLHLDYDEIDDLKQIRCRLIDKKNHWKISFVEEFLLNTIRW